MAVEGFGSMAIVALLSCVHGAAGGIAVTDEHGWPVPTEHWTLSSSPLGYTLVLHGLHSPWQETWYVVEADAQEHFQEIRIDIDGPAAGSPVFVHLEAGSIDFIEQSGDAELRLDHVEVAGDLGRIEASCIGTLIAGHDVTGPIICTTAPNPVRGIQSVTAGRAIRGAVLAEHGVIGTITAAFIGTSAAPVQIRSQFGLQSMSSMQPHVAIDLRTSFGTGLLQSVDGLHGEIAIDGIVDGATRRGRSAGGRHRHRGGMEGMDPILHLPPRHCGDRSYSTPTTATQGDTPVFRYPETMLLHGLAYDETPVALGGGSPDWLFRLHDSACMPMSGSRYRMTCSRCFVRSGDRSMACVAHRATAVGRNTVGVGGAGIVLLRAGG